LFLDGLQIREKQHADVERKRRAKEEELAEERKVKAYLAAQAASSDSGTPANNSNNNNLRPTYRHAEMACAVPGGIPPQSTASAKHSGIPGELLRVSSHANGCNTATCQASTAEDDLQNRGRSPSHRDACQGLSCNFLAHAGCGSSASAGGVASGAALLAAAMAERDQRRDTLLAIGGAAESERRHDRASMSAKLPALLTEMQLEQARMQGEFSEHLKWLSKQRDTTAHELRQLRVCSLLLNHRTMRTRCTY
jgi:hypothetical protein